MRENFNPHSHAGSDTRYLRSYKHYPISIHTPTQGVTVRQSSNDDIMRISIHTPTQGVTILIRHGIRNTMISIHTPTQGVTNPTLSTDSNNPISIHTPTQGVTNGEQIQMNARKNFNPHSHAGSDQGAGQISKNLSTFQSTLPRRE